MDRNFERALSCVLKHEGGWADNPADPGGATMKGVTLATFRRYVKPNATKADLRKITDAQLSTIYRRHYWDAVAGAELPDGVDYAVFDFAVNSGPSRAAKYLQAVAGVTQDGKIGPATLKAVRAKAHASVIHELCDNRLAFLQRLDTWKTFGKGWSSRVLGVRTEALRMAAPGSDIPNPAPLKAIPVTKKQAAKDVAKSKRFWTWLATGAATPLAAFGALDWRVQLALVVVVVGFSVYAISAMPQVRKALGLT
ncbi:hypothetical protein GCM10011491_31250 [Brucella endophytica]|uniref:Secretion activator protein n=1 Tax=Brucella endophytica TaxID=1963359 RepID=A0A916WHM5_9HYPH|nr:glycoside hydrolase family 108 protein [Brucella endophytica]GGB00805.1 hypothetical protein GCM10011491_31250 [Brucella endophytica]